MLSRVVLIAGAALALTAGTASATTMKVNTTADGYVEDGKCGLREAVEAARLNKKEDGCPKGESQRDTIVLRDKTYELTVPSTNEVNNVNGDLDVTGGGPITVKGEGAPKTQISSDVADRVFDLNSFQSDLRLEKLTLVNGDVTSYGGDSGFGGSVRSLGGKLAMVRTNSSSSEADSGGAIYSSAKVTIDRGTFTTHDASQLGGTLFLTGNATIKRTLINQSDNQSSINNTFGGAIFTNANVKLIDSALRGNSADTLAGPFDAYGGAVYVDGGTLTLTRSEVSGNGVSALTNGRDESGAGMFIDSGATANVVNSTFSANNAGSPDGFGGAIYNAGTLTMQHTTLDQSLAPVAGDQIYTSGDTSIGRSIIEGSDDTDPCSGSTVTTLGFNVAEFDDPGCGLGPQDDTEGFLALGTLADNGGPTQTVLLNPTSDAIDFVPKGGCKEVTGSVDQRGFTRPDVKQGEKQPCDAGAYERRAKAP